MLTAAIRLMVLALLSAVFGDQSAMYPVLWRVGLEPAAFVGWSYVAAALFAALAFLVTLIHCGAIPSPRRRSPVDAGRRAHSRALYAKYRAAVARRA